MMSIFTCGMAFLLCLQLFNPMNSATDLAAMVKRQANAWETQDIVSLITDFAPQAVFVAGGLTFNGTEEIQQAAEDYFRNFTDTKIKIKRMILAEHQGAVEWHWSDRNQKTGKTSIAEDAIIFELGEDGKIIYWREYIEKK